MDFLIAPKYRWIYVALFGLMVVKAVDLIQTLNSPLTAQSEAVKLVLKLSELISNNYYTNE